MDARGTINTMTPSSSDAIDAAAAEWVIRLGGPPLSDHERESLDTWLAARREHRQAFEFARRAWGGLGGLAVVPAHSPPAQLEPLIPAETRPDAGVETRVSKTRRSWSMPATVAASLLVACCLVGAYRTFSWNAIGADYYTRVGEVRSAMLPDGSSITLDTDSAVTLHFDGGRRRIRLMKGTARFDVERVTDPESHPFIVEAEGRTIRALGTSFVVSAERGEVTVQVIEHSVLVMQGNSVRTAQIVRNGERLHVAAGSKTGRIEAAPEGPPTPWEHGHLLFDRVRLRDALARMNRYRTTPIVPLRDALAERTISGVFRLKELDDAPDLIGEELKIHVLHVPGVVTLLY
ncbi:MAG: FecR domain-containing protein [Gammaproteobacteria bacterium]